MVKEKTNQIWYLIFILLIGFFFIRYAGFFSIFDNQSYTFNSSLSQEGISLISKSTRGFGSTEEIIIPEERWKYWNNIVSVQNSQIVLSVNAGIQGFSGGTSDIGTTETLTKTNYLNIQTTNLESLSIGFEQQTSGAVFSGSGGWNEIYLTNGADDIKIYSRGGENSQQQSGVIKITKLGDDYYLKINEENSNLIEIPEGTYELMFFVKTQGTISVNEGPNPISSSMTISSITVKEIGSQGNETCNPSWVCTNWTNCVSGQQTRTCTDSNNCLNNSNKPSESQACSLPGGNQNNQTNQTTPNGNPVEITETFFNSKYFLIAIIILGVILGFMFLRRKK